MTKNGLYPKLVRTTRYKPIKNKHGLIAEVVGGGLDIIKSLGKNLWGTNRK